MEARPNSSEPTSTHPKRLSSIKSILNPGFIDSDNANSPNDIDPSLRRSDGRDRYPGVNSPNFGSGGAQYAKGPANSGRDATGASERNKVERREKLQREADGMREALKAKERELEELGLVD
jgi:GATA-binding protein